MTEVLQFLCVPVITIAVYAIIAVINKALGENETFKKFIPLTALALGVIFGILCYYVLPDVISASSLAMAIVMGAASGLAATGGDQIIKQLTKGSSTDEETDDTSTEDGDNEITLDRLAEMLSSNIVTTLLSKQSTSTEDSGEETDSEESGEEKIENAT